MRATKFNLVSKTKNKMKQNRTMPLPKPTTTIKQANKINQSSKEDVSASDPATNEQYGNI